MVTTQKENAKLKLKLTSSALWRSARGPKKNVKLGMSASQVSRTGKCWRTSKQKLQQNLDPDLNKCDQ
ncbi:hypothetical protein BS17DRAFT_791105 [Gyrodon lividus]|nr:hypothetical protein BS17DRAFT_791105 [Gyrodon lividus]